MCQNKSTSGRSPLYITPPISELSSSYSFYFIATLVTHLSALSHQNSPPTTTTIPPWCEAVISSFLFNPLLLVCAFPPFVSMAMPSALHQEPRPACSLISLSPLSACVFLRSYCPLHESHPLICPHFFFSHTVFKSLFFLFNAALYLQLFAGMLFSHPCYTDASYASTPFCFICISKSLSLLFSLSW